MSESPDRDHDSLHSLVISLRGSTFGVSQVAIATYLSLEGTHINELDSYGATALIEACEHGCHGAIEALLELGADRLISSADGRLPIHVASRKGDMRAVNALAKTCGSQQLVWVEGMAGWNAFHYACAGGHIEVVKALVEAWLALGCTVAAPYFKVDRWGATPEDYLTKQNFTQHCNTISDLLSKK